MRIIDRNALPEVDANLLRAAEAAATTATAIYSDYPVGAALLVVTPDGNEHVVTGSNFETLTMKSVCAEKHALMRALAEHTTVDSDGAIVRPRIKSVGVYCTKGGMPTQPCGDCRQTLFEVNGDMRVVAAAGPAASSPYDPRASVTTIRELLPFGFEMDFLPTDLPPSPELYEPKSAAEYVVHFPLPDGLKADAEHRRALLSGVNYMLLVGSPERARKVAVLAHDKLGAEFSAVDACYCDLAVPGRDESHREYALYIVKLPGGPSVAVVSHGVGRAGVEVVISEVPALLEATTGQPADIRGVARAGTRGTLSRVPLGCIALSTATVNDGLDHLEPAAPWVELIRDAARARGMTVVAEDEIDARGETDWPESPQSVLVEGPGLSTSFFWRGQGRPLYRPGGNPAEGPEHQRRIDLLTHLVRYGIRWIEMEDYTVHEVAAQCGYPSVTLGAVIAHRRAPDGHFQIDYSREMYVKSEMIPTELALQAFAAAHGDSTAAVNA